MIRYLAVLFLLAACSSAVAQTEEERRAYQQAVSEQCSRYGFAPGTEAFANCLMQVDMANRQQDAATRQAILQQIMQEQSRRDYSAMPLCAQFPAGLAGYKKARGECR